MISSGLLAIGLSFLDVTFSTDLRGRRPCVSSRATVPSPEDLEASEGELTSQRVCGKPLLEFIKASMLMAGSEELKLPGRTESGG